MDRLRRDLRDRIGDLRPVAVALVMALFACPLAARADVIFYKLPGAGGTLKLALQGKVTVNPGRTVTYQHPTIKEPLYFDLDPNTIEIKKTLTPAQEYNKLMSRAGKDPDEMMKAAVYALKRGLLREFHAGVKKVLEVNPEHETAKKVVELKAIIDKPLPESPDEEKEIRKFVKRSNMRIDRSDHFILLHDTPEKSDKKGRKPRAKARLDLLEQVYESFLLLFHAQAVELDIPRERMRVVLFSDEKDYLDFATNISPTLRKASGFWDPDRNVSVFYDHGTREEFKLLSTIEKTFKKDADEAKRNRSPGVAQIVRSANMLSMLIEVARENADIETVSHEATHQMAGNTGLLPRYVLIPSWVHEGLATYFEAPGDASWAGIGAVNDQRLEWYRALEPDREHSNIDFIVGDQIFDYARSHSGLLHGYGQAWALTHFLMENHLTEFVAYYRKLGEMPPDTHLTPELLTDLFNQTFTGDRQTLDEEWRSYMRGLKSDIDRLTEDAE
jgi:hypothetical protein